MGLKIQYNTRRWVIICSLNSLCLLFFPSLPCCLFPSPPFTSSPFPSSPLLTLSSDSVLSHIPFRFYTSSLRPCYPSLYTHTSYAFISFPLSLLYGSLPLLSFLSHCLLLLLPFSSFCFPSSCFPSFPSLFSPLAPLRVYSLGTLPHRT